jgi:hypothetical protein
MPTTRAKPKDTRKGDRHTTPGYIVRMPAEVRELLDRAKDKSGRPLTDMILRGILRELATMGFRLPKK